jgi:Helix-turn-helix domain
MIDETEQVIGLDDLHKWIPVPRRTITNGIRDGRDLPPHFRVGRKILFRKSLLLEWIEAQERKAQEARNAVGGETR